MGGGAAIGGAGASMLGRGSAGASDDDDDDVDEMLDAMGDVRSGMQRVVWSVDTDEPVAALTFDDGPNPALTPAILDVLAHHGVPATFMMLGHAAEAHPSLAAEVVAAGHEVGNHSWRHLNLAKADEAETRREIEVGAAKISRATGQPISLFRPARGRLNEVALRVIAPLEHDIVLWSVTRGSAGWTSPRRVASHVVRSVGPGDIIDLHDGIGRSTFRPETPRAQELLDRRQVEVAALPRMLDGIAERGIRLVRLSELLPARPSGRPR